MTMSNTGCRLLGNNLLKLKINSYKAWMSNSEW